MLFKVSSKPLRTRTRAAGLKIISGDHYTIIYTPIHYHCTPDALKIFLISPHFFISHFHTISSFVTYVCCCFNEDKIKLYGEEHFESWNSNMPVTTNKYSTILKLLPLFYSKKFSWMSFIALHYSTATEEIYQIQRVFLNPSRLVNKNIQPLKTRSNIMDRQLNDSG